MSCTSKTDLILQRLRFTRKSSLRVVELLQLLIRTSYLLNADDEIDKRAAPAYPHTKQSISVNNCRLLMFVLRTIYVNNLCSS